MYIIELKWDKQSLTVSDCTLDFIAVLLYRVALSVQYSFSLFLDTHTES